MSGEGRPLLPHTAQVQIPAAQPSQPRPQREQPKNYVFVDEHNRHKRLKVMRACEGCRRRKIKCDAATTNSWPCAACTRLKLTCIPPTVSYEKDTGPGLHTFDLNPPQAYPPMGAVGVAPLPRATPTMRTLSFPSAEVHTAMYSPPQPVYQAGRVFPQGAYAPDRFNETVGAGAQMSYGPADPATPAADDLKYTGETLYSSPTAEANWRSDLVDTGLVEALGQLRIDNDAVAPYIASQKTLAEAPVLQEQEIDIPEHTGPGMTVHIPPEMMPSDAKALQYFDFFFTHVHPFTPVLHRAYFYQQWQTDRESISPLVLEAVFACATMMMGEQEECTKWLALASRHEESFKDTARLSTVQAQLLLLKARESSPKRGYFYRSWMTVVNAVIMAKDLELHDHLETHQLGKSCGSNIYDCASKTRVWHTLFTLEVMVGGPQGRSAHDFGVKPDTVDFDPPQNVPGYDEHEMQISRQFAYFMRVALTVCNTNKFHISARKRRKDWAMDPDFVGHNARFDEWLRDVPADLQILFPEEPSLPWIPSPFVGLMHCYHYLSVVMHHRPQMDWLSSVHDPSWREHFVLSYEAAKSLCRISEAIWQSHGLTGLLSMQRGVSFTIYSALTCIMLHLAAITCPDTEINGRSREYFARHMRILEQVAPAFPIPEMQLQINGLREAFSADVTKPFELKAGFPFSSPTLRHETSPIADDPYRHQLSGQDPPPAIEPPGQIPYHAHPMTPPISATGSDTRADSPVVQSLMMMAQGQRPSQAPAALQTVEQWNPAPIFDQWNAAFGMPQSQTSTDASSTPSPPLRHPVPGIALYDQRTAPDQGTSTIGPGGQSTYSQAYVQTAPQPQPQPTPGPVLASSPVQTTRGYVTASMWHDAVAGSFGPGTKRRWDYVPADQMQPVTQSHTHSHTQSHNQPHQ